MSHPQHKVLLGTILQQAGLVTAKQVEQALKQQQNCDRKIGEILVSKGLINSRTADFFAERWFGLLQQQPKQPIGQYLKQAQLLDESQIQTILQEQQTTAQKFGEMAIAKGWIGQKTVDFFLRYLVLDKSQLEATNNRAATANGSGNTVTNRSDANQKKVRLFSPIAQSVDGQIHEGFLQIKRKLLNIDNLKDYSETTLDRVLLWTGGQSFLTRKLFQILADCPDRLNRGIEIDDLVRTKLLDDWKNNEIGSHLQTIEARLLNNQHCHSGSLLRLYKRVLIETVPLDYSEEQQELLNMGLVVRQEDNLAVANRIYQSVFDLNWVNKILSEVAVSPLAAIPQTNSLKLQDKPTEEPRNRLAKFKNIAIVLTSVGLLTIIINNLAQARAVKVAFQEGNELLKQKSFAEAIAQYDRLLKIDSNYFQAWTNRGYALAGLQNYEAMRESCAAATVIEPTAVYAWNCQGEALHNLQRSSEAVAAFDRAIALNRTSPIFLINKSESLQELGRYEESLATIETAIRVLEQIEAISGRESVESEFAVALAFLGNGYRRKERYRDAINAYDRSVTYSANYFPAQIGKGITLSRAQLYREAQAQFQSILENEQLSEAQQAQTWFYLGKTYCNSRQNSLGIAALERSLELEPSYTVAEEAIEQCR